MLNLKVFFLFLFFSLSLHARVFNYNDFTVSTYLRGGYGLINMQKYAFQTGFPATVSFASGDVSQNYNGEIGFGFHSKTVTFRLGAEIVYPLPVTSLVGTNSGTTWLTMESLVFSAIPKVDLEIAVKQTPQFKIFIGAGAGYAMTSIKNTVTLTAPGKVGLGLVNDYTEEGASNSIMGEILTGLEFAFFDNVGLSLDLGYRYLFNSAFTASRTAVTPVQTLNLGDTLRNFGGGDRSVNLSGFFAAAAFRIYIK